MILLVLGTMLWAGLVFLVGGSALVDPLREELFGWVPEWFEFGYFRGGNVDRGSGSGIPAGACCPRTDAESPETNK